MFPYCVGFLWITGILFHIIMRVRLRSGRWYPSQVQCNVVMRMSCCEFFGSLISILY